MGAPQNSEDEIITAASKAHAEEGRPEKARWTRCWRRARLRARSRGPARLLEAMRYATLGGGKRLRPFLVDRDRRGCSASTARRPLRAGCALEMIHCYSLVHDDLPAMDDDDLRRGRPTAHKAFDEATAILAGDALLTYAFDVLADPATHADAGSPRRAGAGAGPRRRARRHGRRAGA